ncbi:MAG: hypothetical protein OEM15_01060 [Myxococcales bacterium]|nr:hypothetical protein [Myxococcales bacterium]MDH3483770.1 hypothetical protein [Myxococcales bacterium]
MNETLLVLYFPVWIACVIGTWLFFRGRDPAFKKRWYRHAYAFNITVIGGMIVLMTIPHWEAFVIFTAAVLFFMWIALFRTRICPSCGKVCQPEYLITPQKFCSKCGAALD